MNTDGRYAGGNGGMTAVLSLLFPESLIGIRSVIRVIRGQSQSLSLFVLFVFFVAKNS